MARAFGKIVWIGFPPALQRRDLWFAESLADRCLEAESAKAALNSLLASQPFWAIHRNNSSANRCDDRIEHL
jgi:hypothetical protein